jgi:hypothetical protein
MLFNDVRTGPAAFGTPWVVDDGADDEDEVVEDGKNEKKELDADDEELEEDELEDVEDESIVSNSGVVSSDD